MTSFRSCIHPAGWGIEARPGGRVGDSVVLKVEFKENLDSSSKTSTTFQLSPSDATKFAHEILVLVGEEEPYNPYVIQCEASNRKAWVRKHGKMHATFESLADAQEYVASKVAQ